ncbi:GNAT family N-acetyltransferase [Marinibacterium profundimaris]|uniref:GNAT family acetyltransferase n=1 Tax=Marinibacterium profundimaris TaxID=1679460 RepID=A0A225NF77_9RHOB|nr:GNAT family N-acetyltransferase [Marinibacterium profundimaris]OWU71683.1 GNAT family acetyltransferase [Marinibacterium profundimaris]
MSVTLFNTPVIETERLVLRAPQASDVEPGITFLMDDRSRYMGGPQSRFQAWRTMGHVTGHWVMRGYGMFIYCDRETGEPLGATGPYFPEGWVEPEFGWSAWSPETEGKGIVREAAAAARDWAWDNLGWTTAVSYIDQDNARSIALAERLGAVHDPDGAHPDLDGWEGTLVFRHTPGVSA